MKFAKRKSKSYNNLKYIQKYNKYVEKNKNKNIINMCKNIINWSEYYNVVDETISEWCINFDVCPG